MERRGGPHHEPYGRRRFLAAASLTAATAVLGTPRPGVAEPPPETTRITVFENPVTWCSQDRYQYIKFGLRDTSARPMERAR